MGVGSARCSRRLVWIWVRHHWISRGESLPMGAGGYIGVDLICRL